MSGVVTQEHWAQLCEELFLRGSHQGKLKGFFFLSFLHVKVLLFRVWLFVQFLHPHLDTFKFILVPSLFRRNFMLDGDVANVFR